MVAIMVLEMMFVLGDERARLAGEHLFRVKMGLDVVPVFFFLVSLVITPLTKVNLVLGHCLDLMLGF